MPDAVAPVDKGAFLDEPVKYQQRAVAFYDVLGWRNKIEAAGANVERVTQLKNVIRIFAASADAYADKNKNPFSVTQSTFSDNVVVSTEASLHSIFTLMIRLAMTQFVAAQLGFYLRGGVTIGDLVHDAHVVFGPALNRAYHLEKTVAIKPKIVLDPVCFEAFGGVAQLGNLVAQEDGIYFLDPWTLNFATLFATIPAGESARAMPPQDALAIVLYKVLEALNGPIEDKAKLKLEWLRDRLGPVVVQAVKRVV